MILLIRCWIQTLNGMCKRFGLCLTSSRNKHLEIKAWSNNESCYWNLSREKFGLYNVKSAYHLIKVGNQNCLRDTSASTTRVPFWKKI